MTFEFLDQAFWNNTLSTWATALGIFIGSLILLQLVKRFAARRLASLAARTKTDLDDLIASLLGGTKGFVLLGLALYFASLALELTDKVATGLGIAVLLLSFVQVGFWGNAVINYLVKHQIEAKLEQNNSGSATAMNAIGFIGKVVLWALLLLLALDNAGVEITTLVASLGIGGIAVALAVQNVLGDLFAALSIVIDQPFAIGDFIIVGDFLGTVENIGLKSTRVRSLSGEELVFSNSDLLNSRIRNYKTLGRRRVVFTIGIEYGTPHDKVAAVPQMIRDIIGAMENATLDRAHFKEFGDFSLNYEVVYYVEDADYNIYMDIQQSINLALYEKFADEGIEFAFPSQTIYTPDIKGKTQ